MKILGVHHVQITVPKAAEKRAKDFYCGVLALQEIEKPEALKGRGGFWVSVGNADVHISIEEGFDRLTTKSHIAYQVEDIDYWKNKLGKENVKISSSIPIPGYERFEFRDPFGNRVEMIQIVNS